MAKKRTDPRISPEAVTTFTQRLFGEELHARRALSLAMAAVGAVVFEEVAELVVGVGIPPRGVAGARALAPKHATKRGARLVGNDAITMARLLRPWVQFVVGPRKQVVVALD